MSVVVIVVVIHNVQTSPESTGPIKAKLHVEHSKELGMNVCINGPGSVTKIAVGL